MPMKHPKKAWLIGLIAMALVMMASAAGGDIVDPLISLSYLTDTFTTQVLEQAETSLDDADAALLTRIDAQITATDLASTWEEVRLKQGDCLTLPTGGSVLILAGSAQMNLTAGTVVNVTSGTELTPGATLLPNNRYMAVEDTAAQCVITSKTAVVTYQGPYSFTYSDTTDYNAIAQGLKDLNLFKGTFTGYGDGFDLEVAPTRLQALIMFIRVLGEEDAALAWTGSTHFTDISSGSNAEKYVGYAYEKGYTNGYTTTTFLPSASITAYQYVEFLLRAMDYRTAGTSSISTALAEGQDIGLLTASQATVLASNTFLRADLVDVSMCALQTAMANDSTTLAQQLINQGVFTTATYQSVLTNLQ